MGLPLEDVNIDEIENRLDKLLGIVKEIMPNDDLLERLAALEHEQWVYWSKSVVSNNIIHVDTVVIWSALWVPYEELSESDKESDRMWARKVLEILNGE